MTTLAQAQVRFSKRYLRLGAEMAQTLKRGDGDVTATLARFDLEWPNIESAYAWSADETGRDEMAALLCHAFATVLLAFVVLRRPPDEHARWARSGHAAAVTLGLSPAEQAGHLFNLGNAHGRRGDFDEGIKVTLDAFRMLRETPGQIDQDLLALGHSNLSAMFAARRDPKQAAEHAQRAIELAEVSGNLEVLGNATGNLAHATMLMGDLPRAAELFEKDLGIAQQRGDIRGAALSKANLGHLQIRLGRADEGMRLLQDAIATARTLGDRETETRALGLLANASRQEGDEAGAQRVLGDAIDAARRGSFTGFEDIARAEMENLPSPSAAATGELEVRLAESEQRRDMSSVATTAAVLASELAATGNLVAASRKNLQAIEAARAVADRLTEASATGNLVSNLLDMGLFAQVVAVAERNLELLRAIHDREGEGIGQYNLGIAYREVGRLDEARSAQDSVLRIAREVGDSEGEALALWELAKIALAQHDREGAVRQATDALAIAKKIGSARTSAIKATLRDAKRR